ncbi:MAG TPA: 3-hydroxyacyl-CoA dehydrogenase family protein [Gemmatimonadaceae bacterium]|nr:3-hydroxyacyl-CoA dehydrogenase family protein [Gemmatimonadaceae bacterium]
MTARTRVAVIGAGTMGHGIAYVSALAGCRVSMTDTDPERLENGARQIAIAFDKAIERGKCTVAKRDEALGLLETTVTRDQAASGADVVIEAVPEKLELKQRIFADIEPQVRPDTILASNTSSLSITRIALPLRRRDRLLGMHFFNPVPVMKLLEVVRGEETGDAQVERARDFAAKLGKTPIVVRDTPGFATSRLGVVLGLEAIRMLEQGVASAEDIDRAMELGYNHPMGPLRLTDLVGLDVRLAIADHLHDTLGGDTYKAPELLREKVARGELGKKTGRGFYTWEKER